MRSFLTERGLRIGFLSAIGVVMVLLGTQLWFLLELRRSSSAASTLSMRDFLTGVVNEVDDSYRENAERLLNLPPQAVVNSDYEAIRSHLLEGRRRRLKCFFVLNVGPTGELQLQMFSPSVEPLPVNPNSPEFRAINLASARWTLVLQQPITRRMTRLVADERDALNPVILKPIADERGIAVGVAGMIIDVSEFTGQHLPAIIERDLARLFPGREESVVVRVRDGLDQVIYQTSNEQGTGEELIRTWAFLFTDYDLSIQSRHLTPAQWAQRSFVLNLSLSGILAALVVLGLAVSMTSALRANRLSEMKTEFVANVSHELRTPLASIRVLGEFLSAGRVRSQEKIQEYGRYIESETERLTALIENILDFAKIDAGKRTYSFEHADMVKVTQEVLQAVSPGYARNGFKIHCDIAEEALPAKVDKGAFAEALTNLLDNAAKYSGSAKDIFVSVGRNNGHVQVAVRDQGIGVAPEETKRIFDKFYRVSNGYVHNVRGSGLGLSITKHIVEAHGGKITVESQPERGSTFNILLPVAESNGHGNHTHS